MPEPPLPGPNGAPILSGSGRTEEQHWRWVLRRLGGNVTDIELTKPGDADPLTGQPFPAGETDMEDCLDEAKRWYAQRVGFKTAVSLLLNSGQSAYQMPTWVTEVVSVWLPSFQFPTIDADQFSYTYYTLLFGQWTNPGAAPMPYSDLVQRLQYLEEVGKIFSTDRSWKWTKETRTLEIMPPPASMGVVPYGSSVHALVTVWSANVDTRLLDPEEEGFFRRRLLIEAMRTLGNVRSKYDTVSMAGGERGLNGMDLKGDADTLEEKLNTDILNWKPATPFMIG